MRLLRRSDEELQPEDHPPGLETQAEERGRLREWQPRLYVRLVLLLATIAYVVAFALENRRQVHLHFVLATSRVSLIWLILLSLALGLVGGVLLSQLYRRRRRRH
jgi:uncharacterized integral membrane protein